MNYIVLELFPTPLIITDLDGEVKTFDLKSAKELARQCQEGMIVPLYKDLMIDLFSCWYDNKNKKISLRLNKYFND